MRVDIENMLRQIGAQVGNRYAYQHMLGQLAKNLLELRDRTQAGDLTALNAFFAIYVFGDGKTYVRSTQETSAPHAVTCKLFPDPHDEREPKGPCTCGAICPTTGQPHQMPPGHVCLYCHIGKLGAKR